MYLLVTQAMPQMRRHAHPNLGRLITPRHWPSVGEHDGMVWAADNDCFQQLDAAAYTAMLDGIRGVPGCRFVTVPDVVGDARATAERFETWAPALERRKLPVALVAQDGVDELPDWLEQTWPRLDALFVGGSTEFKLGPIAERLVHEANRRGLWTHMGRVNTERRLRYAAAIGCNSVDGTKWVRWRDTYLDGGLAAVSAPPQMRLTDTQEDQTDEHRRAA